MNLRNILTRIAALALLAVFGQASAQTSSQPNNSPGLANALITSTGISTADGLAGAVGSFVGGGGGQTAGLGLNMKRFALSGETGAAAAPGAKAWNVWFAYARNNIAYNFAPLQSDGRVNVYLAGIDYTFNNNVVFGVATAVDRTDVDLNFSGGRLKGRGVTVSPYLGIAINKNLAFDATLGYGQTDVDTAVGGVAGSSRTDRNVGTLGLTYRAVIDKWTLTARGAYLAVHDKLGAYTLSNGTCVPDGTVNVSQVRLTGMAAYTVGQFTPYAALTYVNDVKHPNQPPVGGVASANDRDAWVPAIGVRFRVDNQVYGSIQYQSERARSEVKNNQFMFNIGVRF
ncbi:MAG: autotransporter outer membrane beta-barrel domain-containing protein [Burkholderiales bacterium]